MLLFSFAASFQSAYNPTILFFLLFSLCYSQRLSDLELVFLKDVLLFFFFSILRPSVFFCFVFFLIFYYAVEHYLILRRENLAVMQLPTDALCRICPTCRPLTECALHDHTLKLLMMDRKRLPIYNSSFARLSLLFLFFPLTNETYLCHYACDSNEFQQSAHWRLGFSIWPTHDSGKRWMIRSKKWLISREPMWTKITAMGILGRTCCHLGYILLFLAVRFVRNDAPFCRYCCLLENRGRRLFWE